MLFVKKAPLQASSCPDYGWEASVMGFSLTLEHVLPPHIVQQLGLSNLLFASGRWRDFQYKSLEDQILTVLRCRPF